MKKTEQTSQQLVIEHIIKNAGGHSKIAKIVGLYRQAPINWREEGHVPLKWVGQVARALEVTPWALNYTDLANLKGDCPTWKEVVKSLGWPKALTDRILFLSPPVNPLIMSVKKNTKRVTKVSGKKKGQRKEARA